MNQLLDALILNFKIKLKCRTQCNLKYYNLVMRNTLQKLLIPQCVRHHTQCGEVDMHHL